MGFNSGFKGLNTWRETSDWLRNRKLRTEMALNDNIQFNIHGSIHRNNIIPIYISNKMQRYTVYFVWKLLYMFRVVQLHIIRSANNCIYSIWYLSQRYCYLPLSWKSWNWFECAVGGVAHSTDTQFNHIQRILSEILSLSIFTYKKCSKL